MLLKTDLNMMKIIGLCFGTAMLATTSGHAELPDCVKQSNNNAAIKKMCSSDLDEPREKLANQYLTAFLITDAPLYLLKDTHQLWAKRIQQCKTLDCFKQQFELRLDDLNIYISLNQSLTQHYLKFENGYMAKQPVHLKIHQLSKDRIKIEGIAYRSPNNRPETQTVPFLAYSTPDTKTQIFDNEHDCKYQFRYDKAILKVSSPQKGCERFNGIYRLYD
ncbi:hypothetical protein OC498_07830 [Acinetobacter bohemicus]|uniref:A1S_1983 family putative colistin resistance protein n=1 Tax=Acinetobacter TaxID=469 RepID=UPI001174D9D2|nr:MULTISPECIES: hypothetical protein [Acinetobacter]MDM1780379.1 hypothetical protein [Acinetobacter indicus]MCO8042457.1 hypothetical protein [Acinetobacter sp. S4400-12]MCU7224811.1 hypothetical protein [Acinetobacter bohemicus]QKQ70013.1 hypothetical protein E5Y90_07110 [Acinetobacter sp. 10FS3-1]TQR64755.1 hypothetical protein E2K52_06710 [Acinetobacter sp. RF14B]